MEDLMPILKGLTLEDAITSDHDEFSDMLQQCIIDDSMALDCDFDEECFLLMGDLGKEVGGLERLDIEYADIMSDLEDSVPGESDEDDFRSRRQRRKNDVVNSQTDEHEPLCDGSSERERGVSEDAYEEETGGAVNEENSANERNVAEDKKDEMPESIVEETVYCDSDTDDDEFRGYRVKIQSWNADAIQVAKDLEKKVRNGKQSGSISTAVQEQVDVKDDFSDCEESEDELLTPGGSDEDIRSRRQRRENVVVNSQTDFTHFKWTVGIKFPNREEFKDCVTRYAISQGRNLTWKVSDKGRNQRLGAGCSPKCPFWIFACWDNESNAMVVRSVVDRHECKRNMEANRQLKSTWVAKEFLELFRERPHWPAEEIKEAIERTYGVPVNVGLARKVKYHAHMLLRGSMKEHYSKLGGYLEALKKASSTSYFQVDVDNKTFKRVFFCFDGVRQGWLAGCRKVLCLGGCSLKTFLGGMLLFAIGRDANEQMYPLAWAVVEGETNDSWHWFVTQLKKATSEKDGQGWTIISDEHEGILNSVASVLPSAEHRHCARHIFATWHKNFKGDEMKNLFWAAANAYNEPDYEDALKRMDEINPAAALAFKALNPKLFCRAFVRYDTRCDVIMSHMVETFNGYIQHARNKHLICMLEYIRIASMQRMVKKRTEIEKTTGPICPRVQLRLEKDKEEAANCSVLPSSSSHLFQVSHKMKSLDVDLQKSLCTCKKWNLTGIPCCHAIACIFMLNRNAEDFAHEWCKKSTYLKVYGGQIHWPKNGFPLGPPPIKADPGSPSKKSRKHPMEDPKKKGRLTKHGVKMRCSICQSTSHNKRKCPNEDKAPSEQPPKRRRGRPSKVHNASTSGTTPNNEPTHHSATEHEPLCGG